MGVAKSSGIVAEKIGIPLYQPTTDNRQHPPTTVPSVQKSDDPFEVVGDGQASLAEMIADQIGQPLS
jgi:hypothetical protein